MNRKFSYERYHRQIILKDFGERAQEKLMKAKVLVVGAGGLGCPALLYLCGAGVGTIGIIDDDRVSLSNLHRQVLYRVEDIGLLKAERAAAKMKSLNPDVQIMGISERLTSLNVLELMGPYDIIIDGSDNFSTRYLVNDAAVVLGKPVIYGAVSQYEGQVAIFNYHQKGEPQAVNYRDLFAEPLQENEVLNCAEAGVLGVLPGIIGTLQASEAILLITGLGQPLINRMVTFNILDHEWYELVVSPRPGTRSLIPATEEELRSTDYELLCGATCSNEEISLEQFEDFLSREGVQVIDVREPDEVPALEVPGVLRIPLMDLQDHLSEISAKTIITACQSGKRSLLAVRELTGRLEGERTIYSLKGGVNAWILWHSK